MNIGLCENKIKKILEEIAVKWIETGLFEAYHAGVYDKSFMLRLYTTVDPRDCVHGWVTIGFDYPSDMWIVGNLVGLSQGRQQRIREALEKIKAQVSKETAYYRFFISRI